ncbi:MAG: SH3 domain-containing protein [Chloroflexota bacterium]|nr:SH3 domain-containing protein [Chloroflexota bacterium]
MTVLVAMTPSWPTETSAAGIVGERNESVELWQAADGRPDSRRDLTPNQLTASRTLTRAEAMAACGPAAAVALARATGRTITLDAAVAAARGVGWTPERGMAGPTSQVALLKRLGIDARLEAGLDRRRIIADVSAGRPVIIRTWGTGEGHYLVAERYDATSGKFDFGQSALVLQSAGGRRWFALDELSTLGTGAPTHAIYLATGRNSGVGATATTGGGTELRAMSLTGSMPISIGSFGGADRTSRVVDAGGSAARLRAEPSTEAEIVDLVADGTRLTDLGATTTVAGRTWRRVANAEGIKAWIADELLRPAQ